jgi:hypothetical protein
MDMISFGPTIRGAHSPDEELVSPHRKNSGNFARDFRVFQ